MQIITFNILMFLMILANQFYPQQQINGIEHIIVIGVDGMSPDGITNAKTPNIDYFTENGSYTFHARAVLPTSSSSNWASMIMGASTPQHGITSNGWEKDDFILPPVISGKEDIFPTIFSIIREQKPNSKIGAIYHWDGFGRLFEKYAVDFDLSPKTQQETTNEAVKYIKEEKPNFLFIHLDHVDGAGHEFGHGTEKYFSSIEQADTMIGNIYNAVKEAGIEKKSLIIVTSDHGGIGYGHGGETLAEIEIPFILYGTNIKKGYEITHAVYTFDNAATVAFAFNLEVPYAWIGRPIKSAFEGFPVPKHLKRAEMLKQPKFIPDAKFYSPAGGLFIDEIPKVEIIHQNPESEIYYTLNGEVPSKKSNKYTEPFNVNSSTVVMAKEFVGNKSSQTSNAFYRVVDSKKDNGINYNYYEFNKTDKLPNFSELNSKKSGKVYEFRLSGIKHRASNFGVVFETNLLIEKEGEYKFFTNSDDGSKLYVNDKLIVDNDGDHGVVERSGEINLQAGKVKIKVEYFNGGGGFWLDAYYKGPGIPKQIIPADKLYFN